MKVFQSVLFILFYLTVIGLFNQIYAQEIYFCEGVDKDGEPINESSKFTIPSDGGYLYVLVKLPYEIDCKSVSLEVYRNDSYDNTISVDTERNWTWFWKKITFYKSGEFAIDVYDCDDNVIASGIVEIDKD